MTVLVAVTLFENCELVLPHDREDQEDPLLPRRAESDGNGVCIGEPVRVPCIRDRSQCSFYTCSDMRAKI
jgi:hypothetical protein